ncbi:MAG TPA: energy transducer TonB [Polyangia bacterium]|nr:energy transducer TonB [Polyangia bacterium]
MTTAGGSFAALERLEAVWGERRPRRRGAIVGTAVAVGLHVLVAGALVRVDDSALRHSEQAVEMEVQEPPPPPPDVKPEPPPPPPPPEVRPRVVVHHAPAPIPPPEETPPPTAAEPPKGEAPPTFGVSLDSTVAGNGPGMAVPVGNSLMTKPRKAPVAAPPGPVGDPDGLAPAVPELSLSEPPKVLEEVKAEYPPELSRMNIEGHVIARLYIDETGRVRRIKITESTAHGFDDPARKALMKFKFSPARTSDGKSVPTNITYKYTFESSQQ